ncbi:acyltransferase family protein [Methylobacterium sp. J-067]|uniref:acyltransferase family protein n=1 Tax=Methylobacterium sp. J-067 TaxID=2836648 RepID=UPI001FB9E5AE|nr:acyltransferase [Methylobacterium sp. J-067]MCJ2026691.1 acyltransferase [Methylobacterium sp. J-067]
MRRTNSHITGLGLAVLSACEAADLCSWLVPASSWNGRPSMEPINGSLPNVRQVEIDGLRGLAITLVVLGHISQRVYRFNFEAHEIGPISRYIFDTTGASASGVYLIFVISGFLINGSLTREINTGRYELAKFYARRVLRIAPPYLILLFVTRLALISTGWVPQRVTQFQTQPTSLTESLLASSLFLHQVVYGTLPRLFPPGWTLEVEMHFYILSPLLCLGFAHLANRKGLGAASAWTLSAGGVIALVSLASGSDRLQHTLLVFIPLFLLGIVANAVWQNGWRPTSALMRALGFPAFLAFAGLQPWVSGIGMEIVARMVLIAIMFSALASGRGFFYWLCTRPGLAQVGIASYSVYLVHVQVVQAVFLVTERYCGSLGGIGMAIVVAVSVVMISVIATVFYCIIEKPLLGYAAAFRKGVPLHVKNAVRRMLV